MTQVVPQLVGLVILLAPLFAIYWNLGGERRTPSPIVAPAASAARWRLEIYSVDGDVERLLVESADVPFPMKRVRSAKAEQAAFSPDTAWMLPRVELDVEVTDPFTDDSLVGLLGPGHRLRFVTGNEAVVDTRRNRLRIRRFRFG